MRALLLSVLAACGGPVQSTSQGPAVTDPAPETQAHASGWQSELDRLDWQLQRSRDRFAAAPQQWVEAERLVGLLRQRARLTGGYDAYAEAEEVLDAAFAHAPERGGPLATRARLNLGLHRLDAAAQDIEIMEQAAVPTAARSRQIAELRADLLLQRGALAQAEAAFQALEDAEPTVGTAAGLAMVAWQMGEFEAAEGWFTAQEARYHAPSDERRAWVHLQRGLMDLDRGAHAEALAHYQAADALFPGYWLIEEHMAEALVGLGRVDEARVLYQDVVARTGSPELQGALAELLLAQGEEAEARALVAAADAGFAAQAERFPEAAAGHALGHMLTWSDDPAATLALAETNAALRPNGEALTLLAEARLGVGDSDGARSAAQRALATGARSAALDAALAAAGSTGAGSERQWLTGRVGE